MFSTASYEQYFKYNDLMAASCMPCCSYQTLCHRPHESPFNAKPQFAITLAWRALRESFITRLPCHFPTISRHFPNMFPDFPKHVHDFQRAKTYFHIFSIFFIGPPPYFQQGKIALLQICALCASSEAGKHPIVRQARNY